MSWLILRVKVNKVKAILKEKQDYIDTLLTDWHNKELHSVDEVNTYLTSLKDKERFHKILEQGNL